MPGLRAVVEGDGRAVRRPDGALAESITGRNAAAAHLHIDETSWNVYAAVQGKDSHRWWCWVFVGPDTTVFRIAPSRSLKVLTEQLGIEVDPATGALPDTLPADRQVLLSSDFYAVYQSLGRMAGVDPPLSGHSSPGIVTRIGSLSLSASTLLRRPPLNAGHLSAVSTGGSN